jgi:photosystem II stability/assembly factor-like uncharacterized protein
VAVLATFGLTLGASGAALAQARPGPRTPQAVTAPGASVDPARSPFDRLHFRDIGPATPSGRIDDFAVFEQNPAIFYIGTATGGVWKTVNNGTTLEPVFDDQGNASIGAVAIAPGDPNIVWVGTGEANNRQSSSWGDGIHKSTDGGKTWRHMGLRQTMHIARIRVDPANYDVVYVAAVGNLWGPGGERGVYKTADGGLTWTNVLSDGPDVGATDLVLDPRNSQVMYAALYQRRRATWGFNGGGPGSAIYKTADGGRSWAKLTNGLPEGDKGRIGLDVYRKNPNVVYARLEHASESGVYRSDDAGASWRKLSSTNPRPMYFSQMRVDPNDDSRVYVPGVQLHVSDDGGKTFRDDGARNIHVDFHAMWINPSNSNHVMIGGDGGVGISFDRSETYRWLENLPVSQFYHIAYDTGSPYLVCGGLQDNYTWCGPSAVRAQDGIENGDWFIIGGGDGFQAQMDPSNPRFLYAESQDGRMNRVDRVTNERKSIRPEPPEGEAAYRWNWDTPMVLSPHDPATVYVTGNRVFKSTDRGHAWTAISPDLTTAADRDTLELMGLKGRDTRIARNDGVQSYGNLVSFAESPMQRGLYYAGSDDGVLSVSRDGGATWANVTAKVAGLPRNAYVSEVAPSRFAAGTVYATFDPHRTGDFGTYAYASTDFGNSWRSIAGDLPRGEVVRTVTEDLVNADVLYLGTESGLYFTPDRGRRWMRVKGNLPTVPVYEITLHPRENDMILATHGRGVWILDDLTPLQHYGEAIAADAFLFEPPSAVQRRPASDGNREFQGDQRFWGENPRPGAIAYYLKADVKDVKVAIRDNAGQVVRELADEDTKDKDKAGINVVHWDLRVAPLPAPQGGGGGGGGGFGGGGIQGPLVLPGQYRVVLSVDGKEAVANGQGTSRTLTVTGDPEVEISDADRRTWFETGMELHRLHGQANAAADALNGMNQQMGQIREAVRNAKDAPADLKARVDSVGAALDSLRRRVVGGGFGGGGGGGGGAAIRGRITQLKGGVMNSTSLPTEVQMRQLGEVRAALPRAVEAVNALVARFTPLLEELSRQGVYPAAPRPVGR